MQNITIKYRTESFSINIDPTKPVLELKTEVSKFTEISPDNFDLQVDKVIAVTSKEISNYLNGGTNFTMVNVSITVTVVLNGKYKFYYVSEFRKVNDFAEDIIRLEDHNTELMFFYNDIELIGTDTLISSGVVHNAILTSKNGKAIVKFIKKVSVIYREEPIQIDFDQRKNAGEFKKKVSELTGIKVEHFCLKLNKVFLTDTKSMETYIEDGTNFLMVNVTIGINVFVNGKEIWFHVKEESKIDDFKKEIIKEAGITGDIILQYSNGNLVGTSTVLESGLRNNTVLFAIMDNVIVRGMHELTIEYRSNTYKVTIDTLKTITELKDAVSKLVDIKINHFSLHIYWIHFKNEDKISDYMKYGRKIQMWKVTINIIVRLDERNITFSVEEEMTVDNFKMEIIHRHGKKNVAYLSYGGEVLVGDKTLKESKVEHNCVVIAMTTVTGG